MSGVDIDVAVVLLGSNVVDGAVVALGAAALDAIVTAFTAVIFTLMLDAFSRHFFFWARFPCPGPGILSVVDNKKKLRRLVNWCWVLCD